MKAFKLREEKTFVKILKEPPLQKKKVNWNQRIYLALFVVVVWFVGRKVFNGYMIIFADGQIELPKQTVNFSNDIQVLDLFIEEGQEICAGDQLFSYKLLVDDPDNMIAINQNNPVDWIIRERLSTEQKLSLNQILVQNKRQHIQILNQSIRQKEALIVGGIHKEYNTYQSLKTQKAKINTEITALQKENKVLKQYISKLYQNENTYQSLELNKASFYEEVKIFAAPIDGIISDVFYAQNEICYKKEELLTIHQMKEPSIHTYFDPNEIPYLKVGDEVDIAFPDGSKSRGVIDNFFVSTYALPSEFQKKYEPTERNVVASIVPKDAHESRNWKNFYKMDVQVKKYRYQLGFK